MLNDSVCHKQMFALSLSLPHWCLSNYAETQGRVESNFKTFALALETSQVQVQDLLIMKKYTVTRPGRHLLHTSLPRYKTWLPEY